jgi:pyruvate/2-oxoglutarate/acetoin dehydrogenase E1 component
VDVHAGADQAGHRLDTPIPYSKPMEEHVLPNEDKIVEAVRQVLSTTLVT